MGNIDISTYVKIPYLSHGRGHGGVDCFGLVQLVLHEVFQKELPEVWYEDPSDIDGNVHLVDPYRATIEAQLVVLPQEGDIVLMRSGSVAAHIGVYVSPGQVLHASPYHGVVCQKVDSPELRNRIEGFYRV